MAPRLGYNQALADSTDFVIVSVRPQDWPEVRISADGRLVVSVMAGVPLAVIGARTGAARVVRALPNAAVSAALSAALQKVSNLGSDGEQG